jgi:D-alanyl-D-alanine carboxypeptidase/D-alanyl-D-alanine-endopeptidase (penicillin-binding protein 4)
VTGLVLDDGSGLSRNNRCTARQLVEVHRWTTRLPGANLFRESLAEPGEEGSLRKRLKDAPNSVRAKTGTMLGISTLSGFVEGSKGESYAFALMFNGYPGSSRPYKDVQDRVCRILASVEP